MPEKNPAAADLEDPSALLLVGIPAGVENHAVAWLQVDGRRVEFDVVAGGPGNHPHKGPALFSKPGTDQFLVVDPVQPPAEKAARESHFEPVLVVFSGRGLPPGQSGIDGLAINRRDRCDIFR